jgi:hypothetical protein
MNRAHAAGAAQGELFLQNQREISAGLLENSWDSNLTVPESVVEKWISVGTFRAKEKITVKPQQVVE